MVGEPGKSDALSGSWTIWFNLDAKTWLGAPYTP